MIETIQTNIDLCTGCNRCVRKCPMETANITYQNETGNIKVKIDSGKCITCGFCVTACKHDARYFADDTERFFNDLSEGAPISLIAAPSVRINIPEYKKLFTYLKGLGVNKIYDVSLGADICIWAHIRHLEKNDAPIITQPCPVIVTYCELYRHDLLPRLSPVQSPMACASIYMKKYQGITDRIAALTPCIAKSNEFEKTKLAEYNITFARLLDYLNKNNVTLPGEETEFDHDESGLGSLFPMPGGLKENVEYFMGRKLHIAKMEGVDVYEKLNKYAETPVEFLPEIYDVLNCSEGCNIGTACLHDRNVFEINKTMDEARRNATEKSKRAHYESVYKMYDETFDLSHFIREYHAVLTVFPQITGADIDKAFELLGKTDYEKQHVDCGACGSANCRDMARKIALGVNIPVNCIVKSKEDVKTEHEKNLLAHTQIAEMEKTREADERMRIILDANPQINILFDSSFKVVDCNSAALQFMGFEKKEDLLAGFVEILSQSIPAFQPDGRPSVPLAGWLMAAAKEGYVKFGTELYIHGVRRNLEVEFKRIPYGNSFAIIAYAFDITVSYEREKELARAHEINKLQLAKLNLVVKAFKIGLWDMEVKNDDPLNPSNAFMWSDEFRHMLGYSNETDFPNILSSWSDLLHPEDKERTLDAFAKHLLDTSGVTPYDVEYRLLKKNGEYSYYHASGETIRNENGSALRVSGALEDIDEKRRMLDTLESVLNGLDAMIYVSIPETGEILFMNDTMKRHFNLDDSVIGKVCYKVLQDGIDEKCDFCPCHQLDKDPDSVVVWEEHNNLSNRVYRKIDRYISWPDGRKIHLQHNIDITDIVRSREFLERRDKMLAALNLMSVTLLTHKYKSFEDVVSEGLRPVTGAFGIDRIAVYRLFNKENMRLGQIYLWYGQTIPLEEHMLTVPNDPPVVRWLEVLTKGDCINTSVNDVPEDEAAFLKAFGIKSIYFVPIFTYDEFWGVITLENHTDYQRYNEEDLDLLRSVAHLCAGAIVRHETEVQLIAAKKHIEIMLENAPVGLTLFDENFKFIDCNEAVLKMYGVTREFYSVFFGSALHSPEFQPDGSNSRDKAMEVIKKVMDGETIRIEWLHCMPDGKPLPVELTMTRMSGGGKFIGLGYIYDMREQIRLKEEIEAALVKAQAASRAKSDFLANMSHEIRTPMNAIIGMTNIAQSAHSLERKDYALGKIGDASNHLLGVINDILDMSKIEAEMLDLNPETFDFEAMLKKVINIINFRVFEKHQKFAVYIDKNIPRTMVCDDQRLAQVITNLLSNAVKFTPDNGTISLDIKLLRDEDNACEIQFDITDTGVGISEEQQARLFNPFEQAESSTTRKYGGTGLGLAITKRIVELMGGHISVSSVLGGGSTFTFIIKVKKADKETEDLLLSTGNAAVDDIRILIVDDDRDILEYFVDIALRFNITCDKAESGEKALGLIGDGNKYDICFVDWMMPGMNGIELSRHIKAMDADEPVIIMISSAEWQEIETEAKSAGINRFLPKPIFPSDFIECINSCLGVDLLNEGQNVKTERIDRFWGYRLLLAEDVEINREIVIALLEPTLLEIDCAENGAEAVRMFSEAPEKYNIIFMDLQMPEMDGYEATRAIRALGGEKAETIPVIAMTANVFKEDIDNCLKAGMNDHIGKPLDFENVLQILRRHLFKQQPAIDRRKEDRRKSKTDRRQVSERRIRDRRSGN